MTYTVCRVFDLKCIIISTLYLSDSRQIMNLLSFLTLFTNFMIQLKKSTCFQSLQMHHSPNNQKRMPQLRDIRKGKILCSSIFMTLQFLLIMVYQREIKSINISSTIAIKYVTNTGKQKLRILLIIGLLGSKMFNSSSSS